MYAIIFVIVQVETFWLKNEVQNCASCNRLCIQWQLKFLTLMSLTLTLNLTLTLIIVAMNLIKAQRSAKTKWFCPFINTNELAFTISQNCQWASLGSVSCPMGGLGYVDSHESINGLLLKNWLLDLRLRGMGKGCWMFISMPLACSGLNPLNTNTNRVMNLINSH